MHVVSPDPRPEHARVINRSNKSSPADSYCSSLRPSASAILNPRTRLTRIVRASEEAEGQVGRKHYGGGQDCDQQKPEAVLSTAHTGRLYGGRGT